MSLRRLLICFVVFLCILTDARAARDATFTATNFAVNNSAYSFDVYAKSTGTNAIRVGNTDFYFNINSSKFSSTVTLSNINPKYTSGSATGDYLDMESSFVAGQLRLSLTFDDLNGASGIGDVLSNSGTLGERIATINLVITNSSGNDSLSWDNFNTAMVTPTFGIVNQTLTGSNNVPLPVSLTSFDIYKANETSTKLNWATASEENNKGFYIERSLDNENWNVIQFVPSQSASGNSQSALNYTYTDLDVYKPYSRYNTFYYRLRQQDFNGGEEFVGGVKVIRFSSGEALSSQLDIQPNPANNFVNLQLTSPQHGQSTAIITDISGRIMLTLPFENNTRIETSVLKSGIYNIRVKNNLGEIIATEKLVIAR